MEILVIIAVLVFVAQMIGKLAPKAKLPNEGTVVKIPSSPGNQTERPLPPIQKRRPATFPNVVLPMRETKEKVQLMSEPMPAQSPANIVSPPLSPIQENEIGRSSLELELDGKNLLQGIIFSEVLGKPKGRRGR